MILEFFPILGFTSFALSFGASVAVLILLILAAAGFAIWVYRHTVPEVTRGKRIRLIILRSLALAILLFLIFEPVLNLERSVSSPPGIAVLIDDSKSMTVRDPDGVRGDRLKSILSSDAFGAVTKLGELAPILFSGSARPIAKLSVDSIHFNGGETDLGEALETVKKKYGEKNLQAVLLMSDGSYTTGQNPLYDAEALGAPVYTIGIGDSTEKKDLIVKKIVANEIAYVESAVPVDATIQSAGFGGENVEVSLREGGQVLERKQVALKEGINEYPVSFSYVPKSDGVKRLAVQVATLPGELTDKNNVKSFFIKVLKSRMKILLLAGAPGADLALFERVLSRDKNVEVKSFIQKLGGAWYGAAPDPRGLAEADCIFFVGWPIRQSDQASVDMVRNALTKFNKPLFILLGRSVDISRLKSAFDAWLPFDVVQWREDETQAFFEPTQGTRTNPIVSTGFPADAWKELPPLYKTESSFKPRVGAEVLGVMKINGITFNEPMLMARKLNRSKVVASFAYGYWEWELARDPAKESAAGLLIANAVRWLTTREDDKFVRIKPVKEFFDSGERIEFTGQVYNESYEPADDAAVSVRIAGPGGTQDLVLTSVGAGRYAGALDPSGEGDYSYAGTAMRGGVKAGEDKGRFSVGELNAEFMDTKMNNVLLRQIANRSGGKYYPASDISSLARDIAQAKGFGPKIVPVRSDINLWNWIWLLAAAVLCFALEWYMRKQAGMV